MGNCCCRRATLSPRCETVDTFLLATTGLPDATPIEPGAVGEDEKRVWPVEYAVQADAECFGVVSPGGIDFDQDERLYILVIREAGARAVACRRYDNLRLLWQIADWQIGHLIVQVNAVNNGVILFSRVGCTRLDANGTIVWTQSYADPGGILNAGASGTTVYVWFSGQAQYRIFDYLTGSITLYNAPDFTGDGMASIYRTVGGLLYGRFDRVFPTVPFPTVTGETWSFYPDGTAERDYDRLQFFAQLGHIQNKGKILNNFTQWIDSGGTVVGVEQGLISFDVATTDVDKLAEGSVLISYPGTTLQSSYSSNLIWAADESYYYVRLSNHFTGVVDRSTDTGVASGQMRIRNADQTWGQSWQFRYIGDKLLATVQNTPVPISEVNFPA